jgi:uncharacterized protein YjdB
MKKKVILFPLVAALLYVILLSNASGPGVTSGVEGTGVSGAPGCSCHNTSATTSTTVAIQLLSSGTPVTSYVAGQSYTIRLQGVNTGSSSLPKFGFQVSARSSSANAGTMIAPSLTHTVSPGGVNLVEHNLALSPFSGTGGSGTIYRMDIPWTAPGTSGTGTVTLRGVINAVNGNNTNDAGDLWNNGSTTINELGPITGTLTVCTGATTSLANALTGGTWASGSANATVSATGVVTGVTAGLAVISYTAGGNVVTATVTVNQTPTVTGSLSVCQTLTSTLSGTPSGGTWASGTTGVATVNSAGEVTGVTPGTAAITYTTGTGCPNVSIVTVSPYAPITGGTSVCMGSTLALANTNTGGTWSSSNTGVATINTSGVVSPVTAGTTTISYIKAGSCTATQVVSVNALPTVFPVSGGGTYCAGGAGVNICMCAGSNIGTTYNLYNGGTLAGTVAGTGSGVSFGSFTAAGTYTVMATTAASCSLAMSGSATVSINPTPAAITGTTSICLGASSTLANTTGGGSWSSSNPSVAFIGTSSGVVTGTTVGTSTISYVLSGTGCYTTTVVSVNAMPTAITGTLGVCVDATSTLASTPAGGTWSSSGTNVTVNPSTGVITGVSAGTSVITYTLGTGCFVTAIATANALPVISGSSGVCIGSTTTLSATPLGGTWSSGATGIAPVTAAGVVSGSALGTATITYTASNGCISTTIATVNALPTAITGTFVLCANATTTLSSTPTGGTWSSSAPGIASIGSSSGVVSGIAGGTTIITYTSPAGCIITAGMTINAAPTAITGPTSVCEGSSITLSSSGGVTWSSSNTAVATVNASGVVTGLLAGTTTITGAFTSSGCATTMVVTVNALPSSISGTLAVCVGSFTTLSSTPATGTWSSSNTGNATVGFSSGVVSGIAAGTSNITYALSTGCLRSVQVTVNAAPAAIVGPTSLCVGSSATMTDATPSGTWSVSGGATITAGGVVTGTTAGTAVVTYMLGTGCISTFIMTINPLPDAIAGTASVCVNSTTTLSSTTSGGSWTSSLPGNATIGSANGLVTGVAAGTTSISYTLVATGCRITQEVTVNALPTAITGTATVCPTTTTTLASTPSGGTWSSSNTSVATAGLSTGIITGVVAGTSNITYFTAGTGCTATRIVTVNSLPSAGAISGTTSICTGTSSTMTNTAPGGIWSVSNSNATVSSVGVVTGVSAGTVVLTYTTANSCGTAFTTHTINITNSAITGAFGGPTSYCPGGTGTITNSVTGGVWTSGTAAVATIGSITGLVTALTPGTSIITYTISTACGTATDFIVATVNPLPSTSTGVMTVCAGSTTTLSNTGGGTWASGNTAIATVDPASGIVTGSAPGTASITYMLPTGCTTTSVVTVNALPLAITGTLSVCQGGSTTLTNATPGGTWSSSTPAVALIGSGTGVVTTFTAGNSTISYTALGCTRTAIYTVNPLPTAIGGTLSVCIGTSSTLTNTVSGGTWTSSNTSIATIGIGSGVVTGISAGTSMITYMLPTGCSITTSATVNPSPAGITGSGTSCVGATNTLSNATPGGTWISSDNAVATIGSADGAVTGVAVGTVVITYSLTATGCISTRVVTVNAAPTPITGTTSLCVGSTSALSSTPATGTWTSSNSLIAPVVFSSGVVIGGAAGTATITYTLPTGCKATTDVTVNAIPPAISGTLGVCVGSTTTLSNAITGGTWATAATSIATVGSGSGIVTGIAPGNTAVTYTSPAGCITLSLVTVNSLPAAIAGPSVVCAGSTISITNATLGGTWSSSTTSVATVGSITGVVSGVAAGTTTVSYTLVATGCSATATVSVNPLPLPITGTMTVCSGATTTLAATPAGGTWSGTVTGIASIDPVTGIVTAGTAGTAMMTYTLPVTGCFRTATVSVNPLPDAGLVTGLPSVCEGATITLLTSVTGGTWSVTNTHASVASTGIVTGVSAGVDTVIYTVTNACGSASVTMTVSVDPLPVAGVISGSASVCVGVSTTFTSTVPGGMWSSGAPAHVMIAGTAGIASGGSAGADTVFYTVTNGCGSSRSFTLVTVLPHAVAGTISGDDTLCMNGSVHLTPTEGGGAWSAVNTNVSVNSVGHVTGMAAGTSVVLYVVSNACSADTVTHNLVVLNATDCAIWLDVKATAAAPAYELKAYPNPSDGSFTVDIPEANAVMVSVMDMSGRVVASKLVENSNAKRVVFNLNDVAAGSYMVKVDANGTSYRTKMLIVE